MGKKKTLLIIIVIIILGVINYVNSTFYKYSTDLYINWKIFLPEPVYVTGYWDEIGGMDGEYADIWKYNKKQIEKIKKNKHFNRIDIRKLSSIMNIYYEKLTDKRKIIFSNKFNKEKLYNSSNYYAYLYDKNHEDHFLIMILDVESQELYYFLIH